MYYSGHPYHTEGLTSLALTSDSTLALTGSKDGSVHIVNIATGKVISTIYLDDLSILRLCEGVVGDVLPSQWI